MPPYPPIEPYDHGNLDVGTGHLLYWEVCGNPTGKPAVVLHGGPGSGCNEGMRRLFDPAKYRVVLLDQRNCGRSTPHASDPATDLSANTTWALVDDLERVRTMLGIERWLVWGGSWGSTLGLVYAETHPERVSELVLCGVGLGRRSELDWLFRGGLSKLFPQEWHDLCAAVPFYQPGGDILADLEAMLNDADPTVRRQAATAWCLWESATPNWPPTSGLSGRFQEPDYAYAFARIVIHYVRHDLWLDPNQVLRDALRLAEIPGVLVNGRFDFQSPVENVWELQRAWPRAEVVVIDDAGHGFHPDVSDALIRATDEM